MEKNDLLQIAYSYYPYNIDCITDREKYKKSKEFLKLYNKIEFYKKFESKAKQKLEENLKKVCNTNFTFENITYFEWMDRCYTYQYIEKKTNFFFVIRIFESIIIKKYYAIKYFKVKILNNKYIYKEITKEDFKNDEFLFDVVGTLKKNGYSKFNSAFISEKIKNINFDDIKMGYFTYFNAFFNSQNF